MSNEDLVKQQAEAAADASQSAGGYKDLTQLVQDLGLGDVTDKLVPRTGAPSSGNTRRQFFKGLGAHAVGVGAGAFALSMLGGKKPAFAADDAVAANGPLEIWATDRQARLVGPMIIPFCNPCDCPAVNQINWDSLTYFRTTFERLPCDELSVLGVGPGATMVWLLYPRRIRENGPAGTPIGSFAGYWQVNSATGAPLLRGTLVGTIGFDPCLPPGDILRCEQYPRVMGSLSGAGVPDQPTRDCVARWSFCGKEGDAVCDPTAWEVGITGIVECPCD